MLLQCLRISHSMHARGNPHCCSSRHARIPVSFCVPLTGRMCMHVCARAPLCTALSFPPSPSGQVDEAADEEMMREVLADYMQKAHAYKADLGDKRLTVEHMMLAMAEVSASQPARGHLGWSKAAGSGPADTAAGSAHGACQPANSKAADCTHGCEPHAAAAAAHASCYVCTPAAPQPTVLQEQRFGEVLTCLETSDVEGMKKAVRKSRVMYNRGGAEEQPADPGNPGRRSLPPLPWRQTAAARALCVFLWPSTSLHELMAAVGRLRTEEPGGRCARKGSAAGLCNGLLAQVCWASTPVT